MKRILLIGFVVMTCLVVLAQSRRLFTTRIPSTQILSVPSYVTAGQTNDTVARAIYRAEPTAVTLSNYFYIIAETHSGASPGTVLVRDSVAVSNENGCVATLLKRTNYFQATPSQQLSVWFFLTNNDVATGHWCVAFTNSADLTACNVVVLAVTNTATGGASGANAIRQSQGWAQPIPPATTPTSQNPSNLLAALDPSGYNMVFMAAANGINPFSGFSNANSGLVEVFDIGVGSPNLGLYLGINTNFPLTQTSCVVSQSASVAWATIAAEVVSRLNAP